MPEHTIAENLQRLIDAKTAIGSAITTKGGTVGANDGLEEFASDIATIPSGGSADAEAYLMTMSSGFTNTSYVYIVNSTNGTFVYGIINAQANKTTGTLTLTYPSDFTPVGTTLSRAFTKYNKGNNTEYLLSSNLQATITMDTTNHTVTIALKTDNYFRTDGGLLCMHFTT